MRKNQIDIGLFAGSFFSPQQYRCDGPCPCSGGSGNSGIIFGNAGGASNRDPGVLSNPCNCCTKSPPPICNRLADFDCDNCLADNQNVLSCVCPDLYSPVCGNNGRTYSSSCEANCKGESVSNQVAIKYFPILIA